MLFLNEMAGLVETGPKEAISPKWSQGFIIPIVTHTPNTSLLLNFQIS